MDQELDYTTYGQGSGGFNPTQRERRRQAESRHHTDRIVEAVGASDSYARRWSEGVARGVAKDPGDPAEIRRILHNSIPGQMIKDGALGLRANGMLGYGDYRNTAANYAQGTAAGGFGVNTFDTTGRQTGFNESTTGMGPLTEKLAIAMANQVKENLYGKGTANPGKVHGLNTEEVSGLYRKFASRGVLSDAAAVHQTDDTAAGLALKIRSAQEGATDPDVQRMLKGLTPENFDERLTVSPANSRERRELEGIKLAKSATFMNKDKGKEMADMIDATAEGMAALKDVYGALGSDKLHNILEGITGINVINKDMGRRATQQVNRLIGAADMGGVNREAFLNAAQGLDVYGNSNGVIERRTAEMSNVLGVGGRDSVAMDALARGMHQSAMMDALTRSGNGDRLAAKHGGGSRSVSEIGRDSQIMQDKVLGEYQGMVAARGSLGIYGEEVDAQIVSLLGQFDAATTKEERMAIDQQLRTLLGEVGGENGSFESFRESGAFGTALGQVAKNAGGQMDAINANVQAIARNSITYAPMEGIIKRGGGANSAVSARAAVNNLGGTNLDRMLALSRRELGNGFSAADKNSALDVIMREESQMSDEQIAAFRADMLNKDGTFKDPDQVNGLIRSINGSFASGTSEGDRIREARERLAARDSSTRNSFEKGGFSIGGIIRSLTTGEVGSLDQADARLYAVEAARAEGAIFKDSDGNDISDQAKRIDLTEMSDTTLADIRAVMGDKYDLYDKSKYKDDASFLKAANLDPRVKEKLMSRLELADGVHAGGDVGNFTIMSDKFKGATDHLEEGMLKAGILRTAAGLPAGEYTDGGMKAMNGEDVNISKEVLDYGESLEKYDSKEGDRRFTHMGGVRKHYNLADRMSNMGASGLEAVRDLNEESGGEMLRRMEAQRDQLFLAKKRNRTEVITTDAQGKEVTYGVDDAIDKLSQAITLMKDAGGAAKEMRVDILHVGHIEPAR